MENTDQDGIPTDRALTDEEHQKLDEVQLKRCIGIAKSMLQIFAKNASEIDLDASKDPDARKFTASLEPIIEGILKYQRDNGMILRDLPVVDFLFKASFDSIQKALAKHYKQALQDLIDDKLGKPQYELSAQDFRDAWESRVAKAQTEKALKQHIGSEPLAPKTE